MDKPEFPDLLTPAECGKALRLDPKTITRWAHKGLITPVVLPSGHRRYRRADIEAILRGER